MKIIDIHGFLSSSGCKISYQLLSTILSGKKKMSLKVALKFSEAFPDKGILEWSAVTPKELYLFFDAVVPVGMRSPNGDEFHSTAWGLKRIREKYGPKIFKDLKSVKNKPFFTLTWLGEEHGFSREYARQIFEKVFREKYGDALSKKNKKIETDFECRNNPKTKVAEYKKSGLPYKGALAEKLFMCRCEQFGLVVTMPKTRSVDLVVNGFIVDVKSSYKSIKTTKAAIVRYFHFGISPKQREACDFFACYAAPPDKFYIIPNIEKGNTFSVVKSIYIADGISLHKRAKNKYTQYIERFDLLGTGDTKNNHRLGMED